MAKVKENKVLRIECDNPDDTFCVRYTNRGDPFRQGIDIGIENKDFNRELMVMLENSDAKRLRDFLISYYPI